MNTEYLSPHTIRINCECCQLTQVIRDRDGAIPRVCDVCYPHHKGERSEMRAARAESHEALLRERLAACRASEARARERLATAADRVASALASRGALADRLVAAAESDRRHNCPAQQLGLEPRIAEIARKHRDLRGRWEPEDYLTGETPCVGRSLRGACWVAG